MDRVSLFPDFKEFLKLMNSAEVRIEILTQPSGVEFDACYQRRANATVEGVPIPFISLEDLKTNKRAANRLKDQHDLENLPGPE